MAVPVALELAAKDTWVDVGFPWDSVGRWDVAREWEVAAWAADLLCLDGSLVQEPSLWLSKMGVM